MGKRRPQGERPTRRTGEVVSEIERHIVALIGGARIPHAIHFFFRLHQRESQPRIGARYKLAEQFEVDSCRISRRQVTSIVHHAHIVDRIGDQVRQPFIIRLGRKLKRTLHQLESVIGSHHKMHRTLTAHRRIQLHDDTTVRVHRVTQFLIERSLIIQAGRRAQGPSVVPLRNVANRQARRDKGLVVPVSVRQSHARRHIEQAVRRHVSPRVLQKSFCRVCHQAIGRPQRIDQV